MSLDIEKYRKHLEPLNLGKDKEEEIIHYIHTIMEEFVSAAFRKHPVQQAVEEKKRSAMQGKNNVLDSKHHNTTQHAFQDAANRRDR